MNIKLPRIHKWPQIDRHARASVLAFTHASTMESAEIKRIFIFCVCMLLFILFFKFRNSAYQIIRQ